MASADLLQTITSSDPTFWALLGLVMLMALGFGVKAFFQSEHDPVERRRRDRRQGR